MRPVVKSFDDLFGGDDDKDQIDLALIQPMEPNFDQVQLQLTNYAKDYWENLFSNEPGRYTTIGANVAPILWLPIGGGASVDRVVLMDGTVEWLFTSGGGLSIPGSSLSLDSGVVGEWDSHSNTLKRGRFSKDDLLGMSVSVNMEVVKGVGWGGEVIVPPSAWGKNSPLLIGKHGPRIGYLPSGNCYLNYTFDPKK